VPNTAPGAQALAARVAAVAQAHGLTRVHIGVEATGLYWRHPACFLKDAPLLAAWQPQVYVRNPQLVHGLQHVYPKRGKTDRRAAFLIAERVRRGRRPAPFQVDAVSAPLQRLTRFRTHLAHTLAREKSYFLSMLFLKFSAFSAREAFGDPFGATTLAVLETFTTEELAQSPMAPGGATPAHEKQLAPAYATRRWPRCYEVGSPWCCEPAPQSDLSGRRHPRLCSREGSTHIRFWKDRPLHGAIGGGTMDTRESDEPITVVYPRCCGLDVHKRDIQACLLISTPSGRAHQEQRTFATTTDDLLTLLDWLVAAGCTHVAMESTGIYWKPLFNVLAGHLEVLVVNAQHIKQVPGRKTDVGDAAWIAGLLRHGLLRPSFVPARDQRELRELTRYRTSLVQERAAEVNRLQKTLEGANIKVAGSATDIMGKSGREMLNLLVAGETDPAILAQCARGRMKEKIPQLERALAGRFGPHQRFLIARQLAHIDFLDQEIAEVSAEVARRLAPFEAEIALLDTSPGVGRETAEAVVAEIGVDMAQFPSAAHLASWAGMAPGNHQSPMAAAAAPRP
jgi:transposase